MTKLDTKKARDRKKFLEHVGLRLYTERMRRNLTQAEVAASAGVTNAAISSAENAKSCLNFHTVWRLCRALGVSVDSLAPRGKTV